MDEDARIVLAALVEHEVQMIYDDPHGHGIEGQFSLGSWMQGLQKLAVLVGLDWEQTVLNNSTEFERQRFEELWNRE